MRNIATYKFVNLLLINVTSEVCMRLLQLRLYLQECQLWPYQALLQSYSVVSKLASTYTFDNVHC